MVREKKRKPYKTSDNSSNNLNQNEHSHNSATDMKAFQRISRSTDMKAFQRISKATEEKADHGKTGKVEIKAHYVTTEEWGTDKKNNEEAVDFEMEHGSRHKSQQKQEAKNIIMKKI